MKIKPEHLAHLQAAITPLDTAERLNLYLENKFRNADKVRDLNKRPVGTCCTQQA